MNSIPKNVILTFNEDTLQSIRKDYDLDRPGRMDEAIDVLEKWMKKQNHFVKKDLPRDYLERKIIFNKGSVERAKTKLDRCFTLKSLLPTFYERVNFKNDYKDSHILIDAVLPKLTDGHYRIYLLKNVGKRFDNGFTNYFRFTIALGEYLTTYDYCKGFILILDYTETNILELSKKLDLLEMRQAMTILMKGYGVKVKNIHIITPSKKVEILVYFFKQILSTKVGERIIVHNDFESLHKVISKDVLPIELGGNERSVIELHEEWINVISSKKFQEHFEELKKATTNEAYRQTDKFNEEYMGIAGTFRTLNVD